MIKIQSNMSEFRHAQLAAAGDKRPFASCMLVRGAVTFKMCTFFDFDGVLHFDENSRNTVHT